MVPIAHSRRRRRVEPGGRWRWGRDTGQVRKLGRRPCAAVGQRGHDGGPGRLAEQQRSAGWPAVWRTPPSAGARSLPDGSPNAAMAPGTGRHWSRRYRPRSPPICCGARAGTAATLHSLRHTAAYRMAEDPALPLTDVQPHPEPSFGGPIVAGGHHRHRVDLSQGLLAGEPGSRPRSRHGAGRELPSHRVRPRSVHPIEITVEPVNSGASDGQPAAAVNPGTPSPGLGDLSFRRVGRRRAGAGALDLAEARRQVEGAGLAVLGSGEASLEVRCADVGALVAYRLATARSLIPTAIGSPSLSQARRAIGCRQRAWLQVSGCLAVG